MLDEATAEAGSAGVRVLEASTDAALQGRTALVVAHRLTQAVAAVPAGEATLDRDRAELDPFLSSPLWDRLPAVREGRVVEYPLEVYYASPLTALAMVEAFTDALA